MNDLERLKEFLKQAGVQYTVSIDENDIIKGGVSGTTYVKCMEGDTKVKGYLMFYTEFTFDAQGKLREMGAYE